MNKDIETAITRARIHLVMNNPFYGTLALYLNLREGSVPTMGTDGKNLFYDPTFVASIYRNGQGLNELIGAVAHEILHNALLHLWRGQARHPTIWNMAADFANNAILLESGFKLPQGHLYEKDYDGMTAEEIYTKIIQNLQSNQLSAQGNSEESSNQSDGDPSDNDHQNQDGQTNKSQDAREQTWGEHSPWKDAGKRETDKLSNEWRDRVVQAAESAKKRGKCPGAIERLISNLLYPKLDWRKALASFIRPSKCDFTWSPPDRRYLNDLYDYLVLPDFNDESVENIVIAVDTSGSIAQEELDQFMSEVNAIMSSYSQFRGHLVFCDADIQSWTEIERDTVLPIPKGGGGTDFRSVFLEVEKRGLEPSALVFISDGYGDYPDKPPSYPVLWVLTTKNCAVPWGASVEITI
ncbi:MAG: VWA-like domain-containing protein [Coprothermobacterota bacterium]|nr:VWA-like domain-containing protein [Coprothermobacterota bacterium]